MPLPIANIYQTLMPAEGLGDNSPDERRTISPKKKKIPIEIKNALEWNGKIKTDAELSEDETDDDDDFASNEDGDEWADEAQSSASAAKGSEVSRDSPSRHSQRSASDTDNNGFQIVQANTKRSAVKRGPLVPTTSSKPPQSQFPQRSRENRLPRGTPRARPRFVFNFPKDNEARAAFRRRMPHNGTFPLHKDCIEIEPDRGRLYNMFEEMSVRFNSYIRPPQDMHDRELLIWGNPRRVKITVAALTQWVRKSEEDLSTDLKAKYKFPKTYSTIGDRYKNDRRKIQRDAIVHKFQQVPEPGEQFEYAGAFLWPVQDVRPQELFGPNVEAFDPLRAKYRCHIIYDDSQKAFRIFAHSIESVQNSIGRIEGSLRSYVARNVRKVSEIMIQPPDALTVRQEIKVHRGPNAEFSGNIPILTGELLDDVSLDKWQLESEDIRTSDAVRMERGLRTLISTLPYYQGKVRMRVHFGSFELTMFKWPNGKSSISMADFLSNIKVSGTKCNLVRDMGIRKDATEVMSKFYNALDIIVPADNFTSSLQEVAPTFGATFVVHRLKKPSVKLEVEMTTNTMKDNLYGKSCSSWTRSDRKDTATPFEIYNGRVDNGVSWKFQVSTENDLDSARIDPSMREFAESVKLKMTNMAGVALTGQKLFEWNTNPGILKPSSFEQKIGFRYRLNHHPDWMIEIARYDSYAEKSDRPVITNWCALMWHTAWDGALMDNAGLKIGQAARWDPKLETFFPNPMKSTVHGVDAGILAFLTRVQAVTAFLDELKNGPSLVQY